MLKRTLALIIIWGCPLLLLSQSMITFKGSILSKFDSTGIEYAHLFINNSSIGTYSNNQGLFTFNIPDSLAIGIY